MVSVRLPSGRVAPWILVRCKPEGVGRDRANGALAFPSGRIAPGPANYYVAVWHVTNPRSRQGPGRMVSSPPLWAVSHGDDEQLASLLVKSDSQLKSQ